MILDSSMVEHSAVNRVVVGSSPTRGASGRGTGHYGGIRNGFFYSREGKVRMMQASLHHPSAREVARHPADVC